MGIRESLRDLLLLRLLLLLLFWINAQRDLPPSPGSFLIAINRPTQYTKPIHQTIAAAALKMKKKKDHHAYSNASECPGRLAAAAAAAAACCLSCNNLQLPSSLLNSRRFPPSCAQLSSVRPVEYYYDTHAHVRASLMVLRLERTRWNQRRLSKYQVDDACQAASNENTSSRPQCALLAGTWRGAQRGAFRRRYEGSRKNVAPSYKKKGNNKRERFPSPRWRWIDDRQSQWGLLAASALNLWKGQKLQQHDNATMPTAEITHLGYC